MKVEFSRRALADLRGIADEAGVFGATARHGLEQRLREIFTLIGDQPGAAQEVVQRPGVRVLPLVRYPYKVFYRVHPDRVVVLHIRHSARRPWLGRT